MLDLHFLSEDVVNRRPELPPFDTNIKLLLKLSFCFSGQQGRYSRSYAPAMAAEFYPPVRHTPSFKGESKGFRSGAQRRKVTIFCAIKYHSNGGLLQRPDRHLCTT